MRDGSDDAARHPGRVEDRREEMSSRRLAVRAGDAHDAKTLAWMTVKIGRELRQRKPCVSHLDDRHVDVGKRLLCDHGDRAALHGLADELSTVGVNALQGNEDVTR